MYRRLFEEGGELLNLEIGTLSEFSHCTDVRWFLHFISEDQPGYEEIPINECLARRFTDRSGKDLLHRPDGPALIIENMATGHHYFQLFAKKHLRHRVDGPALIADDLHTVRREYWHNNNPYRNDGPSTILIDKSSGKVIDEDYDNAGYIPPEPFAD